MFQRRAGFLVTAAFLAAVLAAGLLYDDLSARNGGGSYENVRLLTQVVEQVREKYVDALSEDELYQRAIRGLVESLDPYSEFLTRDQYDDLKVHTTGNYQGLGISIDIRDDILTVVAPIEGTPAYSAGVHPGDKIVQVDGESTEGWNSEQAVNELRGPAGSKVVLTVVREGVSEALTFTIVRQAIEIPSVPYFYILKDGIGYIRFTQFSEKSAREVQSAVEQLRKQGMRSLVLDVRSNPGGLLDQAIDVSDLFLERGELIVSTRGRVEEQNRKYYAHDDVNYGTFPIAVLVNEGTASASEILAGALQDHDRALILGRTTFGKGLVQSLFPLESGQAALKLTTARYYTPSGRNIQKEEKGHAVFDVIDEEDVAPVVEAAKQGGGVPDSLVFRTESGRTVFGGGGITPDLLVSDTLSTIGRKLVQELNARSLYFDYGVHYRASHASLARDYLPGPEDIADFKSFIRDHGVYYADEEFAAESEFITNALRFVLIEQYYGQGVARKQVMEGDKALAEAVELLEGADTLKDVFRLADARGKEMQAAVSPEQAAGEAAAAGPGSAAGQPR
ncbi:MAG TPA: S41 family peptidase [Gemmatimonadota bacterium]|jgi:carboxyl-terminal processing protease